jgi:hypothetical protein
MNFHLLIRVAGPAVSIRIESVMADFRTMIARWLRGRNDEVVKELASSAGDAVRLGGTGQTCHYKSPDLLNRPGFSDGPGCGVRRTVESTRSTQFL